jgi:hypothetical protein
MTDTAQMCVQKTERKEKVSKGTMREAVRHVRSVHIVHALRYTEV